MTYVSAFHLAQASEEQIMEMKNSIIERRSSKPGIVPAHVDVANEIQNDSRILMETGVVNTTQRDVGSGLRVRTTTATVVGSWGRATNIEYTSNVLEMRAIENMDNRQILSHFTRNDLPSGQTRLCLTGSIHGLLAVAAKTNGLYPLLIDLISQ